MAILIEQALYQRVDYDEPFLAGRSALFVDEWLSAAQDLVRGFGNRPGMIRCPQAVFAQPLLKTHVAVVQAADQEIAGRSGQAFAIYAVPLKAYLMFLGDPFWLARRLPADYQGRGDLSQLSLPESAIPPRSVADLRRVLERLRPNARPERTGELPMPSIENSESPALLGAAQILVDGGRVVFERPSADSGLVPDLWLLLPHSTRARLWPASFAFCNDLGFDALVTPSAAGRTYNDYADEELAADYPEGRYEYQLQRAVENGDQAQLDALLTRRSAHETWKLAVVLLVLFAAAAFVSNVSRFLPQPQQPVDVEEKAALAAGAVSIGDPWSALALIQVGEQKWKRTP